VHGERGPGSVRIVVAGELTRAGGGPATALAVAYGPDGRPAAGTEQTVQVTAGRAVRVMTMLAVSPGTYAVRLAVGDHEGRSGSLDRTVDATWHEAGGVTATGLVLFRSPAGAGGRLEPVLDTVSTGDRLIAQVPLSAPLPAGNGQVAYTVARDGEALPLLRLSARIGTTSTGALVAEGVVPAADLSPGRYTIAASIGRASAIFTRTFRVEAVQ
jgi:hypothetical protein